MRFIADFHVHSKFSRAMPKNLDFENLYIAAQLKGIMVVGTADFTDAHSPLKLGREANLFNTDMSYPKTKCAIKSGDSKQFLGTFEFYPEEGKYHLDGHRKCNVRRWLLRLDLIDSASLTIIDNEKGRRKRGLRQAV